MTNSMKEEIADWKDYCDGRLSDQQYNNNVKINDMLMEKILRALLEIYERLETLENKK